MSSKDGREDGLQYASSCCIPTTWKEYNLIEVTPYNHDTSIFAFGLNEGQSLNLPVQPLPQTPTQETPFSSSVRLQSLTGVRLHTDGKRA